MNARTPCPRCGSTNLLVITDRNYGGPSIGCDNCGHCEQLSSGESMTVEISFVIYRCRKWDEWVRVCSCATYDGAENHVLKAKVTYGFGSDTFKIEKHFTVRR